MPNTALWLTSNDTGAVTTAASTQFQACAGITQVLTEAQAQIAARTVGTFSHLYVRLSANSNSLSTTFTFRKAAGNGNQTISIATTVTGDFEDATHTDTNAAGDLVNFTSVMGAGTGTVTIMLMSVLFTALDSSKTVTRMSSYSGVNYVTATQTLFNVLNGLDSVNTNTTEAPAKARMRKAGTFSNLYTRASVNGNTNAVTYTSRLNGGNGNLTVSVTAGSTGVFEDTTHSDTVVPGDDYCHQFVTGASTVSFTPRQQSVEFSSQGVFSMQSLSEANGTTLGAGTTTFFPLAGRQRLLTANEAFAQAKPRIPFTFYELTVSVTTNGATSSNTLTFRKNAVNANQTVSITNGVTGVFSDSLRGDYCLPTDELTTQIVTPAASAITIANISVWATAYRGQNFSINPSRALRSAQQSPVFG